jgi:ADP-ribosylation factor protein 1
MEATKNPTGDFIGFLLMNPQLSNGGLFLEYYTKDHIMNNPEARSQMVLPDIKPLPSLVTGVGIDAAEDTTVTKAAVDALPKAAPNSDEEFIQQFEDKKLNRWNHECFLRVIFIYLNKLGRKEGVNKVFEVRCGIPSVSVLA